MKMFAYGSLLLVGAVLVLLSLPFRAVLNLLTKALGAIQARTMALAAELANEQ